MCLLTFEFVCFRIQGYDLVKQITWSMIDFRFWEEFDSTFRWLKSTLISSNNICKYILSKKVFDKCLHKYFLFLLKLSIWIHKSLLVHHWFKISYVHACLFFGADFHVATWSTALYCVDILVLQNYRTHDVIFIEYFFLVCFIWLFQDVKYCKEKLLLFHRKN